MFACTVRGAISEAPRFFSEKTACFITKNNTFSCVFSSKKLLFSNKLLFLFGLPFEWSFCFERIFFFFSSVCSLKCPWKAWLFLCCSSLFSFFTEAWGIFQKGTVHWTIPFWLTFVSLLTYLAYVNYGFLRLFPLWGDLHFFFGKPFLHKKRRANKFHNANAKKSFA